MAEFRSRENWIMGHLGLIVLMLLFVEYINWKKLARSHCWSLGDRLGISQWVVSNCIVHDCWLVDFSYTDFYFSLFLLSLFSLQLLVVALILYFTLCQLLNHSYLNPQIYLFPDLVPISLWR